MAWLWAEASPWAISPPARYSCTPPCRFSTWSPAPRPRMSCCDGDWWREGRRPLAADPPPRATETVATAGRAQPDGVPAHLDHHLLRVFRTPPVPLRHWLRRRLAGGPGPRRQRPPGQLRGVRGKIGR